MNASEHEPESTLTDNEQPLLAGGRVDVGNPDLSAWDLLRALFENLPENIFFKDACGRFLLANGAEVAHRGLASVDELIGKTDFDFYEPEEASRYQADERRLIDTGQVLQSHEETEHDQTGRVRWKQTTKVPLRNASGKIVGIAGISQDITDRKEAKFALQRANEELESRVADRTAELTEANESLRDEVAQRESAEQALRESESHFRSVAESAGEAVLTLDANGAVVFWNRAASRIFGHTAEEMIGKPFVRIFPERFRRGQSHKPDELIGTGRANLTGRQLNLLGVRKDGQEFSLELSVTSWRTQAGTFYTAMARDISERKRAEDDLRRLAGQLRDLTDVAKKIATQRDPEAIRRLLVTAATKLTDSLAGAAGWLDGHRMAFQEYYRDGKFEPIDLTYGCGEGVPGWVIQTCEPYLCNAVETDMQVLPDIRKALGFYDLLNVPILGRDGRLLGCVEVHNTRNNRGFNERDVQALQTLAELGAGAMENAALLTACQTTEVDNGKAAESVRRLAATAMEGLIIVDHGTVLEANAGACSIFDRERSELLGQDLLTQIIAPDSADAVRAALRAELPGVRKAVCIRPDGEQFSAILKIRPTQYEDRDVQMVTLRRLVGDESD